MKRYYIASVKWISLENGGRKMPCKGTRYCPIIRLNQVNDYEDWSIDFICPDFSKESHIRFKFLVDNGPDHLIKINQKYEICEGNKKVAEIIIKKIINY